MNNKCNTLSGINCYCYNEPNNGFPLCFWEGYVCSGDVCYVHRELINGVFYTTWNCLRESEHHIDLICDRGAFNTDTDAYACCRDADNCNQNLEIVLPVEVPVEQIPIIVPSTTTASPRPPLTFSPMIAVNNISSPIMQLVPLLESSSAIQSTTRPVAVLPSAVPSTVHEMQPETSLVPESTSVPSIIKGI